MKGPGKTDKTVSARKINRAVKIVTSMPEEDMKHPFL